MIHAREFVEAARAHGFEWYAGVPCSFLTPFINYVIDDPALKYVSAANEGDAVALAAGATIGGKRAVAMMQNSGLGNAVSPLTSLTHTFGIPVLLICTHRGAPGVNDEPQHELMGTITDTLFETMRLAWSEFPRESAAIGDALQRADQHMQANSRPYALLMRKGTCATYTAQTVAEKPQRLRVMQPHGAGFSRTPSARASRNEVLGRVIELNNPTSTVVIASTGFTGRELYALDDRSNHLYMVGSMGCASSLALGLALARPDLRVVVLDGDGAALMRMGNFATIGAYPAANLVHVLLDNEAHDSTGAQATVSASVDFAAVAAACAYPEVWRSDNPDDLEAVFNTTPAHGPRFVHMKIRTGTLDDLPRPAITPAAVLDRLMRHIGSKP